MGAHAATRRSPRPPITRNASAGMCRVVAVREGPPDRTGSSYGSRGVSQYRATAHTGEHRYLAPPGLGSLLPGSSLPPAAPGSGLGVGGQAGISCRGWSAWSARGSISSGPLGAPRPVLLTAVDTGRTCSGSYSIPVISLWASSLFVRVGGGQGSGGAAGRMNGGRSFITPGRQG